MIDDSPVTVFWALEALGFEFSSAGLFRESMSDFDLAMLAAADCKVTTSVTFFKYAFTALTVATLEFESARLLFSDIFQ